MRPFPDAVFLGTPSLTRVPSFPTLLIVSPELNDGLAVEPHEAHQSPSQDGKPPCFSAAAVSNGKKMAAGFEERGTADGGIFESASVASGITSGPNV
jgi:hypothetical protein